MPDPNAGIPPAADLKIQYSPGGKKKPRKSRAERQLEALRKG